MNVMMELRKCCNHPYLVRGAEERIVADAASQLAADTENDDVQRPIDHGKLFGDQLIKSSGKMVLIHKVRKTGELVKMYHSSQMISDVSSCLPRFDSCCRNCFRMVTRF